MGLKALEDLGLGIGLYGEEVYICLNIHIYL